MCMLACMSFVQRRSVDNLSHGLSLFSAVIKSVFARIDSPEVLRYMYMYVRVGGSGDGRSLPLSA